MSANAQTAAQSVQTLQPRECWYLAAAQPFVQCGPRDKQTWPQTPKPANENTMKLNPIAHRPWKWIAPLVLSALVAACGGGDPVLGFDGSGNGLVNPVVVVPPGPPLITPPGDTFVPLGAASTYGAFGGAAGVTNQGLLTIINGDLGTTAVSTAVTGFRSTPDCTYTVTGLNQGRVTGSINTAPPPPTVSCPTEGTAATEAAAIAARADARAAYNRLAGLASGSDPGAGNLANLVLASGVYTAAGGTFMIQGGNLTLDGRGDPNSTWVFQMAQTLTVGGPGAAFPQSVVLINGAQAKNVFWQVGSAATINAGGGGTMHGTIISQAGAAFSTSGNATITTLNGRVLSLDASVTLVNTVITVPAP